MDPEQAAWRVVAAPDGPFWRPFMEYLGLTLLDRTGGRHRLRLGPQATVPPGFHAAHGRP